jgi:hypothetical protein
MKKITPNQFVSLQNNWNTVQQHCVLNIKPLLLVLIMFFFLTNISAQNKTPGSLTVLDVSSYISSLKGNNQKTRATAATPQYVENLVFGIQSAVYYQSGIMKNYGDNPVKLFLDVSTLSSIPNPNLMKDNMEIVVIKINNSSDLNLKIDLLKFSDFPKLKYIYILSSVNVTDRNISNMFLNYDNQYNIFYKIEIGQ